ncbi:MAG: SAM-dependent methyltransferase [Xanthobacteraceae bacterium]
MTSLQILRRPLAAVCLVLVLATNVALAEEKPFEPQIGQEGKDVIWVPTAQALVDRMLDLAKIGPDDFLIDLGSGDGRTVITAARRGVRAMGVEYNPDMVALSRANAKKAGVSDRATFTQGDLFATDFSKATVVTMFLLPSINLRLRPLILNMKPGTRVVSNSFDMGEWEPDQASDATEECRSYCRALYWVVPAKVAGTWKVPGGELALEQQYQMLTGTMRADGESVAISGGRMIGDRIVFSVGGAHYSGRVNGNAIEGMKRAEAPWSATR